MTHKKWAVAYAISLVAWISVMLYTLHQPRAKPQAPMIEQVTCQTALGKDVSGPAKHWNMEHGTYYHDRVVFSPPEGSECGVAELQEPKL